MRGGPDWGTADEEATGFITFRPGEAALLLPSNCRSRWSRKGPATVPDRPGGAAWSATDPGRPWRERGLCYGRLHPVPCRFSARNKRLHPVPCRFRARSVVSELPCACGHTRCDRRIWRPGGRGRAPGNSQDTQRGRRGSPRRRQCYWCSCKHQTGAGRDFPEGTAVNPQAWTEWSLRGPVRRPRGGGLPFMPRPCRGPRAAGPAAIARNTSRDSSVGSHKGIRTRNPPAPRSARTGGRRCGT